MEARNHLIIIGGEDKTDSIASYQYIGGKCNIVYHSSTQVYSYNSGNVRLLPLKQSIDPQSVIFKAEGVAASEIDEILDFGDYYRVVRNGKKDLSYPRNKVQISENCLTDELSRKLFDYFKETAEAVSLETEGGINILSRQYGKITAVAADTVLSKYLNPRQAIEKRRQPELLIYPFGLNQSQKLAVENAFSSQISIIQGPPGTGKTQTILNIIANAIRNGKTIAVVSNNNPATKNVAEKLEKQDLSFLTAFLGRNKNKETFLESQTGTYPNLGAWTLQADEKKKLEIKVAALTEELNTMLNAKNRIAKINRELLALDPEWYYFREYYQGKIISLTGSEQLLKFSSQKLISLWLEYENCGGERPGLLKRLSFATRFSKAGLGLFRYPPKEAIPFLQDLFYKNKTKELQAEREALEQKLNSYRFDAKMKELSGLSMQLFKAEIAQRYNYRQPRPLFEKKDFQWKSDDFIREYPVILSTTYSIKGTLSPEYVYDYLIVDEASQVDLATGVLAFSCAKNIIIVGDQKQLPNVLTPEDVCAADAIWNRYHFDERYHFSTHSMLASAAELWEDAPSVLLREHYRCHPKIADFFNQKFYGGNLIVMTEDKGEKNVLSLYRTAPGEHARGHVNQRQIDVIREEILPALHSRGFQDIGIITPYRDQVSAIRDQLGERYKVNTVHKFQGRENEAIILTSVDNEIGKFVDDPNMLNVAVSRAVKSLSVVISNNRKNNDTNYGDLIRYISYNNYEILDSQLFSVFDLLYKEYYAQRVAFLKKHKRVSEYDSENLAYAVIKEILQSPEYSQIDCAVHFSLATLIKDESLLTEEEAKYAANPLTHLDFLLFNKMDKAPIMAIEIDGVRFHEKGSRQAERDALKNSILEKCQIPLLRIRTNESGEASRIAAALHDAIGGNT